MIILGHIFNINDYEANGYYSSGRFTYKILKCKTCKIKIYYRKTIHYNDEYNWLLDGHFWNIDYKNNLTCDEMMIKNLLE